MRLKSFYIKLLSAFFIAILLFNGNVSMTANAQMYFLADTTLPQNRFPKKVRIKVDSACNHAVVVEFDGVVRVEGIKTNSKKLKAYNTVVDTFIRDGKVITEIDLGFYAAKQGTYKVTFNLVREDGTREKQSMKVYAYDGYAIEKATYGGKQIPYPALEEFPRMNYPARGRLKIKLFPGYKLVRIEKVSYKNVTQEDGSIKTEKEIKKIKNGSMVSLSNVTYKSQIDTDNYKVSYDEMHARTIFRIYYKDKYAKDLNRIDLTLYKLVNYEK
jgi:hypothetical protein